MTAALEGGEWSAARPWPHFTPRKDSVPIVQEAGWAPAPVCTGRKSRPHRDSIPDRPARSQPQYRLSYPAHVGGERSFFKCYKKWYILLTTWHLTVNAVTSLGASPLFKKGTLQGIVVRCGQCTVMESTEMMGWD